MKISPFNGIFFAMFAVCIAIIVLMWAILRKKSEYKKINSLILLCIFNIIVYFVYKKGLSVDKEFIKISGIDKFNWFNELPLQLCNINMFIIPLGVLTKRRALLGFSFFLAPLGAFMALIFPEPAFSGFSLLVPRIAGYYITHFLIFISGISLATLGFYRPKAKDIPKITSAFIIISFSAHIVNSILRISLCPFANYFYTYGADISILNLFWKIIPVPFLYLCPSLLIMFAYMGIVIFIFWIPGYLKSKKSIHEENCETIKS